MHHRMPLSKTGWPSLNVVIFPPVMRLVLDDPKQWPTRRLLITFTSKSQVTARFRAKSIAERLGIHVSGLGPSFMKIWTCGSSPRSGYRNTWTWIKKVNSASRFSKFWIFFNAILMISRRDCWPWTKPSYITMTRRQSNNQWSGGITALPIAKNPTAKIRWKSSRLDFFKSRRYPPHWLSSKGPNYQTWSINHLCWCNWMIFWRKSAAKISPRWSCSCTKMLRLTGHLQPRRKWPTWVSNVLITHPILRIWPRRTTTCSLHWKSN